MKHCMTILYATIAVSLCVSPNDVRAQGFGGFGGAGNLNANRVDSMDGSWDVGNRLTMLPLENALGVITIDGTADIRVVPEEIRVVLAITTEGKSADQCQQENAAQVAAVLNAWNELKIPKEKVVEDFINILPRYEWRLSDRDGQQVRIQQREGYRMQSNLHVSVKTEKDAMEAIHTAFKHGVTDIVTFDYWSSQLDKQKEAVRADALKAAQRKAATLLGVFDVPPKIINIQEKTAVFLPHSLYRTYENVLEEQVQYSSSWRDKPAIKAYRPKMTFFDGLQSDSDMRPRNAAMHPEIAVVSTVRLYYQSPADKQIFRREN